MTQQQDALGHQDVLRYTAGWEEKGLSSNSMGLCETSLKRKSLWLACDCPPHCSNLLTPAKEEAQTLTRRLPSLGTW
jgi:hypothetical protein